MNSILQTFLQIFNDIVSGLRTVTANLPIDMSDAASKEGLFVLELRSSLFVTNQR